MPKTKVRVRFAPSPTGFLHIGSLRTALYNYLFAKKNGGDFLLRIEDTDRTRFVEGGIENIIRTLKWCGLEYNEEPLVQSQRLDIYKKYAEELVKKGKAYYCYCTSERLEQLRQEQMARKEPTMYDGHCRKILNPKSKIQNQPFVIRLKVPKRGVTKFSDIVRGEVSFENKLIDDQVLLKSDGYPTYHLANIVDDHLMNITHVIRGEEWVSSTPKHILLYKAFGWKPPQFAHLPLLLNADHSKLSKRQGDVAVEDYIKKGYLKEALINFIALLGWNPKSDQEIYTLKELIQNFDLNNLNKSGAVVNFEKLDWMNGQYIRQLPIEKLTKLCIPYLEETIDFTWLTKIVALEQERLKKLNDIVYATEFFFVDQPHYEPEILRWKKMSNADILRRFNMLIDTLQQTDDDEKTWNRQNLEIQIRKVITAQNLGTGETLWPMRVALSGRQASPGPFEIAELLGKTKTIKRLEYALELAKKLD